MGLFGIVGGGGVCGVHVPRGGRSSQLGASLIGVQGAARAAGCQSVFRMPQGTALLWVSKCSN